MYKTSPAIWSDESTKDHQLVFATWIEELRDRICSCLSEIESECSNPLSESKESGVFEFRPWLRETDSGRSGGGGVMGILKNGRVFEKAGVNISTVSGRFSKSFSYEVDGAEENDGKFWASGLSMVIHPLSPLVPAYHMNCRMISTSKSWFGAVADLNPPIPFEEDTKQFHKILKDICDKHGDIADYQEMRDICEEYFHIKHRDISRGVGGIFFDNFANEDWQADFDFVRSVGEGFFSLYPPIVKNHMEKPWTSQQREIQLYYRGRYAEFNLIYDRGTRFGLMTGANPDAVLMSLPPLASW